MRVRSPWRVAVPLVMVATGLLVDMSVESGGTPHVAGVHHSQLVDLVAAQQGREVSLSAQVASEARQVDRLTAAAAAADAAVGVLERSGSELFGPVGLDPVSGAGLTVVLSDAPPGGGVAAGVPAPTPDDLVVHQQELQAVVNALWAGGARAMAIMGQRVVSTTAVECVGNTLLLQGQVYSPPYVVSAVGPPHAMAAALATSPDVIVYREYVRAYDLGYAVEHVPRLDLAGYAGPLELQWAQPLRPGG